MRKSSSILLYNSKKEVLLQNRTDDAKRYPGVWGCFGGGMKKKETPLECVKRECFEELGYELENPLFVCEEEIEGLKIYIFVEKYDELKKLILKEGKGMGWFKIKEIHKLKLAPPSKKIIEKLKKIWK